MKFLMHAADGTGVVVGIVFVFVIGQYYYSDISIILFYFQVLHYILNYKSK